ncbi:MAG: small subunit ribosomal protein [Actinomycetota bacterium]|jgi:small subunit ribosomal protein S16|nr:small subunit ribosomal protein [Actinomycetota bacterium]
MVKIRLKRVGKKKQPSYRVVVADSRSPRDGRIIESIGHYNPRSEPSEIVIDTDRANYWLGRGAQASETVGKLLQILSSGGAAAPAAATPKRTVKATPAASVSQDDEAEDAAAEEVAETPEAVDQEAAAPEAEASDEAEA